MKSLNPHMIIDLIIYIYIYTIETRACKTMFNNGLFSLSFK